MRVFTQIAKHEGRIDRVPRGETPVIELTTEGDQYVANVSLEQIDPYAARNTLDWRYTYFVVTPLGRV